MLNRLMLYVDIIGLLIGIVT